MDYFPLYQSTRRSQSSLITATPYGELGRALRKEGIPALQQPSDCSPFPKVSPGETRDLRTRDAGPR